MTTKGEDAIAAASYLEPVERESTPSIIAHKLRNAIAHGELALGVQLAEAELARELGVSRGPLREAMQRLTQEGLLLSIRNRGLFVIELLEADVRDIYVARDAVERAAAAQMLQSDHARAGAQLSAVIDPMVRAAELRDAIGMGRADLEFHGTLVRLSGSPRLIRMHETLLTETSMCIMALRGKYPDSDDRAAEHREIAMAITAGDSSKVDLLITAHMDDAVARLAPRFAASSVR